MSIFTGMKIIKRKSIQFENPVRDKNKRNDSLFIPMLISFCIHNDVDARK